MNLFLQWQILNTYAYQIKIYIIKCVLLWAIHLTVDNESCSMNLTELTEPEVENQQTYNENMHAISSWETTTKNSVAVSTDL